MTTDEEKMKLALAHAICVIGRLLPGGMEVRFTRLAEDAPTVVMSRFPDGEITEHVFQPVTHH